MRLRESIIFEPGQEAMIWLSTATRRLNASPRPISLTNFHEKGES